MTRDHDWYFIDIYAQGELNVDLDAEQPCSIAWFTHDYDCDNIVFVDSAAATPAIR